MKVWLTVCLVTVLANSAVLAADEAPPAGTANGTPEATVERVFAAWIAREGRLRSARAEWTERMFHGRGSLFRNPARPHPEGEPSEAEVLPAEDTYVELSGSLTIEGSRSRFERRGPVWLFDHGTFAPRDYVSVFGESSTGQHFSEVPGVEGGVTFLTTEDRAPHAHDLSAFPASFAVRPVDAALARLTLEGWELESGPQRVLGRECLGLVRREGQFSRSVAEARWLRRMWVDPERDFVLVQFEEGQGDVVYHHVEIEYDRHASGEWLPAAWRTLFYTALEPDRLRQQIDGRATKWELNGPVDSATFEVPAPPRTWVQPAGAKEHYIVRADGSRRPILESELRRGATQWQLIESEPGQAALPPAGARGTEPLLTRMDYAVGALILAGLGLCFAAARRRKLRAGRVGSGSPRDEGVNP
jgi:hypothetical protein